MICLFWYGWVPVSGQHKGNKKVAPPITTQQPIDPYVAIDKRVALIPSDSARSAEQLARYLSAQFTTDEERVRAAYRWLGIHIAYDTENQYAFTMNTDPQQAITDLFSSRKAICEGYAMTFTKLCELMGIRSYVIGGYTKTGRNLAMLSHAWSAVSLDGKWYLFDPTWGAGYVQQNTFVRQPNDVFYRVPADEFIPTHVPFDPLWQFLFHPVSHRDFMNGRSAPDPTSPSFNYPDSLRVYDGQSEGDRMIAEARRIEQSGVHNDMTFQYLSELKRNIDVMRQNAYANRYNQAADFYNNAVRLANAFIDYRNKQFQPQKPEADVRAMLDTVANTLIRVRAITGSLKRETAQNRQLIESLEAASRDVDKLVEEQQIFLNTYYKSPKLLRRLLFAR